MINANFNNIDLYDFHKTANGGLIMEDLHLFKYDGERKLNLAEVETDFTGKFKSKDDAANEFKENIEAMIEEQNKLFASGGYALLLIFQAMDAAGKDGAISHVMSGLNPQGTQVFSFKQPSDEELRHDYLWRVNKCLPERGKIGIFNRSYYEEMLVVRVHDLIAGEHIPEDLTKNIWENRYEQINNFERYLFDNGIIPVKFFLNISKGEQKKRLLARIDDKAKNWKFSEADIKERGFWDEYQKCYEETINKTSSKHAPWHVIPSDKKWYSRLIISEVIVKKLKSLNLKYPELSKEQEEVILKYRKLLEEDHTISC
jgi:PPK2 family polyphosphate:nucleotide phosphotransferase